MSLLHEWIQDSSSASSLKSYLILPLSKDSYSMLQATASSFKGKTELAILGEMLWTHIL